MMPLLLMAPDHGDFVLGSKGRRPFWNPRHIHIAEAKRQHQHDDR